MADNKNRTGFFFGVFCILVLLTLASFAVGNFQLFALQRTKWIVMIGISVAKAAFVILFFMHFWWEKSWKYLLTIPTTFMAILLVVALVPDIMQRHNYYSETRINNAAIDGVYSHGDQERLGQDQGARSQEDGDSDHSPEVNGTAMSEKLEAGDNTMEPKVFQAGQPSRDSKQSP